MLTSALRLRRQEIDLVLRGQPDHLGRIIQVVALLEQSAKLAGGSDPKQTADRARRVIKNTMRHLHRQSDQVAGTGARFVASYFYIKLPLEHVNEFILGWMDMWRDETAWRKQRMPSHGRVAVLFERVGLTEDVPNPSI